MIKIYSASGAAAPDPAVPCSHMHYYQTKCQSDVDHSHLRTQMIIVHNVLIAVVGNVIIKLYAKVLAQYWLLIASRNIW